MKLLPTYNVRMYQQSSSSLVYTFAISIALICVSHNKRMGSWQGGSGPDQGHKSIFKTANKILCSTCLVIPIWLFKTILKYLKLIICMHYKEIIKIYGSCVYMYMQCMCSAFPSSLSLCNHSYTVVIANRGRWNNVVLFASSYL